MARNKRCKVFVSYSRHDEALVKPLAGLLGAAVDDAVFLDVDSIKPGNFWKTDIEDAVRNSSVFILCWCCESKRSEFVQHEIDIALKGKERRLVPVLLCSTPLPQALANRQWVDLRGRVVHSCSRHDVQQEDLPAMVRNARPLPPSRPLRSAPLAMALLIFVSVAVSFFALFFIRNSKGDAQPPSLTEESAVCLFSDGPRAGETQDYARNWPSPRAVGSPCEDGAGSTGRVIAVPPAVPVPSGPSLSIIATMVFLAAVIIGLLFRWVYKAARRRQTDQVAALATGYFERLGSA